MKKFLPFLFFFYTHLILIALRGNAQTPCAPVSGLVAQYAFDETQGSSTQDATGQLGAGVLTRGSWAWQPSGGHDGGGALAMTGSALLDIPLYWTPTAFSFSFWLKPTALSNYGQVTGSTVGWGAFLFTSTATGGLYVGTDQNHWIALTSTPVVQLNVWQHFVFTFNNGEGTIYKNGQQLAKRYDMALPTAWQGIELGIPTDAVYDELRVYNRAVSPQEVSSLYSCAGAATFLPPSNPNANTDRNWTLERSFDGNNNVVAESKQFTDALGRPTQAQARNAATKQVFAAQTIYNTGGQAVLQTLAAPTNNQDFNYKEGFITAAGAAYSGLNFEQGKASAPDAVDAATPGTLGYYFSKQNVQEPLTPVTGYPYSLVEPYEGPLGGTRRAAGPGDELRMGKGREAKGREFLVRKEFDQYLTLRPYFLPASSATTLQYQAIKSVSINANGQESIVVASKEGQTLLSCLSGPQYPALQVVGYISSEAAQTFDPQAPVYADVHIPAAGSQDVRFTVGGSVRLINLLTDERYDYPVTTATTTVTPGPGCFPYTVSTSETRVTLAPGFYRFVSLSGTQGTAYEAHYGNFSYTYYDEAGRAITTVAPKDLTTTTTQPLYTTRNTYDTSSRLLATESNDEGRSEYVYASDGRIRFSQSALQRPTGRFSYSNYDEIGRIVESGEYTPTTSGTAGVEFEGHSTYGVKRTGESLLLEAENSRFADNNGNRTYAVGAASNGYEVAYLQAVGNFVEFSAPVGADGTYELQLRYSNGMGNTRTMALFVNGTQLQQLAFAPTAGWETFATLRLAVPLQGGTANLIRIEYTAADNGSINVDYLRVTPPLIQEAEEAVFADSNVGQPANSIGASGGRAVAYLTSVGNYVDFSITPPAGQTGVYELQLGYANGRSSTRTMNLRVNGVSIRQLSFLPTDTWDTFSTLHTTATLQGGTVNHIRIEYTSADVGYVNVDNLRVVAPSPSTLKQEAESTRFTNTNGNSANTVSSASGGQDVGYLTAVGTKVPFTLTAVRAGTYTLSLRYATGGADTRTMSLLVNEAPATQLALPGTSGWTQFATFTTRAPLRAGMNTIQVLYGANDTGYADIDYLQADEVISPLGHDQSVQDLVDNRTRTGGLATANCAQRNQVWYDLAFDGTAGSQGSDQQLTNLNRQQQFLVGAVAKTKNDNVTTWYSYDELGRVTWVVQDITGVGVKTLDYQYDFSGNVLQVAYQQGQADGFYHYYTYDAAQRLTTVTTSPDGTTRTLQAEYSYYLHGPLKRVKVAGNLQGVDYAYTLQGTLKSINHSNMTLEPGHDAPKTNGVYKDLFALTLEYFSGDYASRNLDVTAPLVPGAPSTARYDGTIQAAAWRTGASADIQRMAYAYDEKSQLQNSVYSNWKLTSPASTTYQLNSTVSATALQEGGMSYDQNGNLLSLRRTNQAGATTDNFSYTYKANTNQLKEVHTGSATGTTVLDYDYDELGHMTRQRDEQGQRYLSYDVTDKTTGLYADANKTQPLVTFAYDDRGFRVSKTTYSASFTPTRTTYYVRDVAGNILTVYDKPAATGVVQRSEVPLYGSGRLGTLTHLDDGTTAGTDDYRYELTDHLGDARVVFHRPTTETGPENFEGTASKYAFQPQGAVNYGYASSNALSAPDVALLGNSSAATGTLKRTVSVQQGDTITFTAWARTTGGFGTPNIVASPTPAATASRVQPFLLLGAAATIDDTPTRLENGRLTRSQAGGGNWLGRLAVGLSFTIGSKQPATPSVTAAPLGGGTFNAWIQYQVKDANGQPVGQPQQVLLSSDSPTTWQKLQLGVRVQQGGSVELTASSAETSSYVMFDNLAVEQTGGLIVQEQHQYAFGAPLPGLSYTVGNRRYRYGYQGQYAEHDDETGFESFELRLYNSRVGRWLSYDTEGQFDSPYVGMGNNPVSSADPDGGWSWTGAAAGTIIGAGIGGVISSANGGSFWKGAAIGAGVGFAGGGVLGPKVDYKLSVPDHLSTLKISVDWNFSFQVPNHLPGFDTPCAYLLYTGARISWVEDGKVLRSFNASSGLIKDKIDYRFSNFQNRTDRGPIQEGWWRANLFPVTDYKLSVYDTHLTPAEGTQSILDSDPFLNDNGELVKNTLKPVWGTVRIKLTPLGNQKRTNQYLHNSQKSQTHGCVECENDLFTMLEAYRKTYKTIDLLVNYHGNHTRTTSAPRR